jgi:dual specificity phosphatase 12
MITKIWHRLSVGSLEDARRLASPNPLGIKTVVSLCPGEVTPRDDRIEYAQIPIADSQPINSKQFDKIMTAIANGVRQGPVLVHCLEGISRSPLACSAWMHAVGYRPIEAALAEIADLRAIIDPSPVLLSSIRRLLQ